jgi:hypothetical protein
MAAAALLPCQLVHATVLTKPLPQPQPQPLTLPLPLTHAPLGALGRGLCQVL